MNMIMYNEEDIQRIENKLDLLISLLQKEPDLTTRSGVREYLGVTDNLISVMMNDGRLKEGVHFTKQIKGKKSKITFIESAIKELKG